MSYSTMKLRDLPERANTNARNLEKTAAAGIIIKSWYHLGRGKTKYSQDSKEYPLRQQSSSTTDAAKARCRIDNV